jgi:putative transposase
MRKEHLKLTESEHSSLTKLTTSGQLKARQFKRAMTLLLLDEGKTLSVVSKILKYCYPRVLALRDNYLANGLECLQEKPRAGRPPLIDGLAKAKITALACSTPPAGRAVWSLRLLADKAVELELVETISHNEVGRVLKKMNSNHI